MDNHYRSIVKGVTWRIMGTLDTFLLTLLVTGELRFAFSVSALEVFTKVFLFWLHERIWLKIGWGR